MKNEYATGSDLLALFDALRRRSLPVQWLPELCGWDGERLETTLSILNAQGDVWGDARTGDGLVHRRDGISQTYDIRSESGLFPFASALFSGDRTSALEALATFLTRLCGKDTPALSAALFRLYLELLLETPLTVLAGTDHARFVRLGRKAAEFSYCIHGSARLALKVLLRGRAAALRRGDPDTASLFSLMCGGFNVIPGPLHNSSRLHALMTRGYEDLHERGRETLLEKEAHLVGVYYFMEGKFQRAIDTMATAETPTDNPVQVHAAARRGLLSAVAYCQLGENDQGHELLRRTLRRLPQPGFHSLARQVRAYIAVVLLRRKDFDQALERLDIALGDASPGRDLPGWVSVMQALSLYHASQPERIVTAYTTLCNGLDRAAASGYRRPLYLFPEMLELFDEIHAAGLGPVPGYDRKAELERCLHGPNTALRGTALRIRGKQLIREEKHTEALDCLQQSLALFRSVRAYDEVAKTRWELTRYHLGHGEEAKARSYAMEARLRLTAGEFPQEFAALLPELRAGKRTGPQPGLHPGNLSLEKSDELSEYSLLIAYLESLHTRDWSDKNEFLESLVASSCTTLGMSRGGLFVYDKGMAEPKVLSSHQFSFPSLPERSRAEILELVGIALTGNPVVTTAPAASTAQGRDGETTMICIPVFLGATMYVLYHDGILPAWRLELIREELLDHLGRLLARELTLAGALPENEREQDGETSAAGRHAPASSRSEAAPPPTPLSDGHELIVESQVMRDFLRSADLVARSDASVYISGETGAGKEVVARRIHALSGRKGAFVAVNLAGIPDELFENEMLGHEKGAFTGANIQKPGLLEMADNGTLFLDELEETSPRVQTKLLRLLQERSFTRLGGTRVLKSRFRLIAAGNGDITAAIRKGLFRKDLFYRVCVAPLHIPPLRERKEDIRAIARYYHAHFSRYYGKDGDGEFSAAELEQLMNAPWPGNVRELKNFVERCVILRGTSSPFDELMRESLSFNMALKDGSAEESMHEPDSPESAAHSPALPPYRPPKDGTPYPFLEKLAARDTPPSLDEVQEAYARAVLLRTHGKIDGPDGAAAILGLGRSTLYALRRKVMPPDDQTPVRPE